MNSQAREGITCLRSENAHLRPAYCARQWPVSALRPKFSSPLLVGTNFVDVLLVFSTTSEMLNLRLATLASKTRKLQATGPPPKLFFLLVPGILYPVCSRLGEPEADRCSGRTANRERLAEGGPP